jgi:signal peptidase I
MAYYSKLTPSDNITAGDYGYSVAVGNDKIAVGANLDDIGGVTGAGSVYIYNIDGTGEVKISGSDITGNNAAFGSSVSIGNSKLAVGATGAEQVYVYDLDGTNEVILNTSQTLIGGYGDAVVIFDGKLYVGAPSYNTGRGAVFVYELSNLNQTPVELQSSDADVLSFGDSISVGDNRIVIGAPGSNNGIGRVYVYDLQGQNEYKLNPSDQPALSAFGIKVAIGSGKIVVTSPSDDVGSAYIYNTDGSGEIKITQVSGSSQGSPLTDNYGTAVAIGSSKVIVGAHDFSGYPYSVGNASKGGAFVYGLDGLGEYYFWPADAVSGDHFGHDLQIYKGYLISSSIYKPSVYVYDIYPAGTTVKNLSSSSYTGTINGGTTFNSAGYFDLDGVDGYIDTGLNVGSVTELTVEVWLRVDTYTNDGAGISIGDSATSTGQCYLGRGNSGGDSIDWRFYTGTFLDETEFFTSDTGWKHYIGTYDQSGGPAGNQGRMILYVDGVQQDVALSNNTSAINFAGGTNIRIGTNTNSGATSFFDGKFGEVRIYNRALSPTEVSQNFNATRSKYGV